MSLIYRRRALSWTAFSAFRDYWGEIRPFASRIKKPFMLIPMIALKTIEWTIYRWYKTPARRFYGVRGNELIFMISKRCNARCAKCGIWKVPEPEAERIAIADFLKCLDDLHRNLYQVTLTGGEPLLFADDVLRIAAKARSFGVRVVVVTNGSLLSDEFLTRYSSLDHVLVFSIDTLDRNKWMEFRGIDDYDRTMQNIAKAKKLLGGNLRIQSVMAEETEDDILGVGLFCAENGIQHSVQPYMDFGGIWHAPRHGGRGMDHSPCAARKNICIYPNGDVVKCFDHHRIPLAREPLGNIGKDGIISILCRRRSTEVTSIMKSCFLPCRLLACNVPPPLRVK